MTTSRHRTRAASAGSPAATNIPGQAWVMLAVATVGFAVNFWAWALISPLGAFFTAELGLSALQKSLLVAVPVVVGSVGRIPVGAMTDRLGARVMFPVISALTILPVLFIGYVGNGSYGSMLLGGLVLGLGGTTFAIGVPLVNAWFPPAKRGTALGIFGAGMGGTAISAFSTVQLKDAYGLAFPFTLVAILLAAYAVVSYLVLRDAPGTRTPASSPEGTANLRPERSTGVRTSGRPAAATATGFIKGGHHAV